MTFIIATKNNEKTISDKDLIYIGSNVRCDYVANFGFDFMLAIRYDKNTGKCFLINQANSQKFLFKGNPLPLKMEFDKVCKIMVADSDEFITIKLSPAEPQQAQTTYQTQLTEDDIKTIYGNDVNASVRLKIEKQKNDIEHSRVSIIKQVGAKIKELHHRISMNSKAGILLHIGLFLASFICAFGISNYLTGLPLEDVGNVIQMPTNLKLILVYTVIVYGVGLLLKHGLFLYLQNKLGRGNNVSAAAEKIMIVFSSIFYVAIYLINVSYYMAPKTIPMFAVFISMFFVGTAATLAIGCGYFKSNNIETRKELDGYEYREDFEHVIKEYQLWIERFANTLTSSKINAIKEKLFNIRIHAAVEVLLGLITAPFLAYGVSNTLAMCFPEAAGWVRISGLRFSPIFLVLATLLIIFAFLNFVYGFLCNKKIQASNVIKQDGFSEYLQHGVTIYGLEGARKMDSDMRRSFLIGACIIFIEFSMNVSYFMQSIGGDVNGMLLSGVAALVPTAILIAETFFLAQAQFETFACEELLSKIDRE